MPPVCEGAVQVNSTLWKPNQTSFSDECFLQVDVFRWRGELGLIASMTYYSTVIILSVIVLVVSKTSEAWSKNFIVMSFMSLFGYNTLHSLSFLAGSAMWLQQMLTSCHLKTWTYILMKFTTNASYSTLAGIVIYHHYYLRRVHIKKKRVTYVLGVFAAEQAVIIVVSTITCAMPLIFQTLRAFWAAVLQDIISQIVAIVFCIRIWRMPCWKKPKDVSQSYLSSIKTVEYLLLASIIVSATPGFIQITSHVIVQNATINPKAVRLLRWIGHLSEIGGILHPLLYMLTRRAFCFNYCANKKSRKRSQKSDKGFNSTSTTLPDDIQKC